MTDELDLDALEAIYERALDLEKGGDLDQAASAYREMLVLDPADSVGASVRLAAMGRGDTPPKAPDAYVATLFDQHADVFESILVDQLGYRVPEMVREALDGAGLGPFDRVLDLGCGSGLAAEALHDISTHLTGVDLSENMIEIAGENDLYAELYIGEAVRFLQETRSPPWNLIVATDVLPYMGGLDVFFGEVAAHLSPGGVFAFSDETLPAAELNGQYFKVGAHHRFAHDEAYIRRLLAANGFDTLSFGPITVRHEEGEPVPGHLVVARRG